METVDSEFNDALSSCVERLSLIDIGKYEVENSAKLECTCKRWEAKNSYQAELRTYTEVPNKLTFDDLMRTPLTRAMKKREYDMFMKAILGNTIDSEDRYIQYINQLYKSAEFDHTTKTESIEITVTTVLSVIAIGSGLMIVSGGLFGFAVPGYLATAGQVAGGILTAKDIGHLITGKDINGNPLSDADRQAITSSFILDATMVGVNSLSKLKLKYANKVNKVDDIKRISKAEEAISKIDEIEVKFNYKSKYDEAEFARQLADQEEGMNKLTVDEYLKNRERYIAEGRAIESNIIQQAARKEALAKKIAELRKSGLSYSEAKKQAESWMTSQTALHNPDQIAGGNPSNVGGVGDKKINSSIGSQWKYRIDIVDERIKALAEKMTEAERKLTYLNVKLKY